MDGLVFIVVIVLFWILEGVLKKQKARQTLAQRGQHDPGLQEGDAPTYPPQSTYDGAELYDDRPSDGDRPSYDDQPSYDEQPSYDDQIDDDIPEYSNQYRAASQPAPTPSETLIPRDVWEEIAGLVSGVQPSAPTAKPEPRSESATAAPPASYQPAPKQEHFVHRSHAGYGTDPSSRAPSEQDGLDPLAERLGADAGAVHDLFASRDPHALRKAIILQEVLGRPAAFRGDPYEP